MTQLKFRIVALSTEVADAARKGLSESRPDHRIVLVDSHDAAPCRHCLQWAKPGEQVIRFPYDSVAEGRPYTERGPIFVHAEPCPRYTDHDYPEAFRTGRAFRAYDSAGDMIDACLPN